MEKKETKIDKAFEIIIKITFSILIVLGAFTFIAMGIYIAPRMTEHMIEIGRPAVQLFRTLFTIGIMGGAWIILVGGIKIIW